MSDLPNTTQLLLDVKNGGDRAADRLLDHVYGELRDLAAGYFRRQQPGQTLQPTALVHEAFLKLIDQTQVAYNDRTHFFAVAAKAMRQILIDHARARNAAKRGGGWERVTIANVAGGSTRGEIDVLALDESLDELAKVDERQAQVVELRFFGGLSVAETAEALRVSTRTVELDWKMAKAWLSRALSEGTDT